MASEERRPRSSRFLRAHALLVFGLLFLPLFIVLWQSVRTPEIVSNFTDAALETKDPHNLNNVKWSWSLASYELLFTKPMYVDVFFRSLRIAGLTSVVAGLLGGLGAIGLSRGQLHPKIRVILQSLVTLPLLLPELVLGLSSVIWFVTLRIALGEFSVILAHVTFTLSYVFITVQARLAQFDPSLEDAAADLGANGWQVFRRVTWPIAWPGIMAGALMAFMLSFDDFLISFFTAGAGSDTLPLKLYSMVRFGVSRELYALASLLIFASVVVVFLARAIEKK